LTDNLLVIVFAINHQSSFICAPKILYTIMSVNASWHSSVDPCFSKIFIFTAYFLQCLRPFTALY